MGRQEGACWRCGAQWAVEDAPQTTLRVIAGGRIDPPVAQLASGEDFQTDRWMDEGGSDHAIAVAVALPVPAARR